MLSIILFIIIITIFLTVSHIAVFSAGLVQYSNTPKEMWFLNSHQTKHSLLGSITSIQQMTGGTQTGDLTTQHPEGGWDQGIQLGPATLYAYCI